MILIQNFQNDLIRDLISRLDQDSGSDQRSVHFRWIRKTLVAIEDDWVNSSLDDEAENNFDKKATLDDAGKEQNVEKGNNNSAPSAAKNVRDANAMAEMEKEMTMLHKMKQKFDWLKSMFTSRKQNQLLYPGPVKRSRIELTIPNCAELFTKPEFSIVSEGISLFGFDFKLMAQTNPKDMYKDLLGLFLCVYPPSNYKGPYSVDVDCSFRVMNKLCKDDVRLTMDQQFNGTNGVYKSWGKCQIAKLETLLDRTQGFITKDGKIYVDVEFKIKSATMGHMLMLEE